MEMLGMQGNVGNQICYNTFLKAELIKTLWREAFFSPVKEIRDEVQQGMSQKAVDEIKNYIASSQDRFSGELTIAISANKVQFRPISLPLDGNVAYEKSLGLLQLNLSDLLLIDGHHRLVGIVRAMETLRGKSRQDVGNDDVPVVIVVIERDEAIISVFHRLRRYARCSDRGENIRSAYDDPYAVLARRLMKNHENVGGVIPENLVNWRSNTLTNRLHKFTTISVLYDSVKLLLPNLEQNYSTGKSDDFYDEIAYIWNALIAGFNLFHTAISGSPEKISDLRDKYLCLKASGQIAIIGAVKIALDREMNLDRIIDGLNKIPWNIDDSLWKGIIVVNRRISASTRSVENTSALIAYLIGASYSELELRMLHENYRRSKSLKDALLPERIVSNAEDTF